MLSTDMHASFSHVVNTSHERIYRSVSILSTCSHYAPNYHQSLSQESTQTADSSDHGMVEPSFSRSEERRVGKEC